jgi:hypothetical protein
MVGDNLFDFKRTGAAVAICFRSQPGTSGTVTVKASHRTLGQAEVTISVASILAT